MKFFLFSANTIRHASHMVRLYGDVDIFIFQAEIFLDLRDFQSFENTWCRTWHTEHSPECLTHCQKADIQHITEQKKQNIQHLWHFFLVRLGR